jgi:hypothetical protein
VCAGGSGSGGGGGGVWERRRQTAAAAAAAAAAASAAAASAGVVVVVVVGGVGVGVGVGGGGGGGRHEPFSFLPGNPAAARRAGARASSRPGLRTWCWPSILCVPRSRARASTLGGLAYKAEKRALLASPPAMRAARAPRPHGSELPPAAGWGFGGGGKDNVHSLISSTPSLIAWGQIT